VGEDWHIANGKPATNMKAVARTHAKGRISDSVVVNNAENTSPSRAI
jgi:hypothetical protein